MNMEKCLPMISDKELEQIIWEDYDTTHKPKELGVKLMNMDTNMEQLIRVTNKMMKSNNVKFNRREGI